MGWVVVNTQHNKIRYPITIEYHILSFQPPHRAAAAAAEAAHRYPAQSRTIYHPFTEGTVILIGDRGLIDATAVAYIRGSAFLPYTL